MSHVGHYSNGFLFNVQSNQFILFIILIIPCILAMDNKVIARCCGSYFWAESECRLLKSIDIFLTKNVKG